MSDYLSAEQFADAQANIAKGSATLTIPRATARQFFTRVSNQGIKGKTGQTVLGKSSSSGQASSCLPHYYLPVLRILAFRLAGRPALQYQ
jgi:hypothetical protein|tara:strand:- start:626 stop:895 length:270 start_codon:yes stop_codon:yes gene_type:complete